MDTYNQDREVFTEQPSKLPPMLNVLTILTFIGCGLAYVGALWGFFTASPKQAEEMEEMQDKMADNEIASSIMQGSAELAQKSYENRYVLLASGLIFTTLCLVGALQMRKLKKSGYYIYLVGEVTPLIVSGAILGFSLMNNISLIFGGIIALVFIILYTTQLKYMTR
ncbi:MAG TPA: hypothetical protein VFZ78_05605 [Flavisolibacter sp.]